MAVGRVGRQSGQRFSSGKDYIDPRIPDLLRRMTETYTPLDGEHARDLSSVGTGTVEVHQEMQIVEKNGMSFRRKQVVFEVWEYLGKKN